MAIWLERNDIIEKEAPKVKGPRDHEFINSLKYTKPKALAEDKSAQIPNKSEQNKKAITNQFKKY